MPRYFFHLIESGQAPLPDEEGEDLADLDAAREEGLESLRDIVADGIKAGRVVGGLAVELRDEAGALLAIFSARDLLN